MTVPALAAAQGAGAAPAPAGRIPVVLLPIQTTVFTVGYGDVKSSPDLTKTSRANLDAAVRAAIDESATFALVELPPVTAGEKAAIDEFLQVSNLVLLRVDQGISLWGLMDRGASIDRTLGSSLAFLRDRTGADYALGTIGYQVRERGYKAIIDSALTASTALTSFLILPSVIRNSVGLVLIDLRTGELQWFNLYSGHEAVGLRTWDLQDPDATKKVIDKTLAPYPRIPPLEGVTTPPASPTNLPAARKSSPAKGQFEIHVPDQWQVQSDVYSVQASRDGVPFEKLRVVLRSHVSAFPESGQGSKRSSTPAELADRYVAELEATKLPELQVIDVSSTEQLAGQPAFRVHFAFRLPSELFPVRMEAVAMGTAVRDGLLLAEFSATQLNFFPETLPAFEASVRTLVVGSHPK